MANQFLTEEAGTACVGKAGARLSELPHACFAPDERGFGFLPFGRETEFQRVSVAHRHQNCPWRAVESKWSLSHFAVNDYRPVAVVGLVRIQ